MTSQSPPPSLEFHAAELTIPPTHAEIFVGVVEGRYKVIFLSDSGDVQLVRVFPFELVTSILY